MCGKKRATQSIADLPTAPVAFANCGTKPLSCERLRFAAAMTVATVLFTNVASNVFGVEPAELILATIARSQAITSGRITYTFESESFLRERALKPISFPEVTTAFSDSSWAERSKSSHLVRINHNGYFLEFVQTPQRNGTVRPGATLHPKRSLENRVELNSPPIFAGSFWHAKQRRYVEKHAKDFQFKGSKSIHEIPVVVLELTVPTEDHREAFHVVLPRLKSGGVVRLYVAQQLGFVLPRIEFVTPSGEVAQSYDAMDFSEVAPGIYFPRRLWTETHAAGGTSPYRGEFIAHAELINQTIPQEDFIVELPPGTHIQDAREPGQVVKFNLAEVSSSSKLVSHSWDTGSGRPSRFLDRWRNAVMVGAAIGTLASISFLLAARNQRNHA